MPSTVVGRSVPRVDGKEKVTGVARYGTDVALTGMLHARLVLSPHAHARILAIDTTEARAVPGVAAVLLADDLQMRGSGRPRVHVPLARERVAFCGQPVAVVLAENESAASDAAQLVAVEYEVLPAVVDPEEALKPDAPVVRAEGGGDDDEAAEHGVAAATGGASAPASPNVSNSVHFTRGDVAAGFADADVVVERTYRTEPVHQAYMEPHATVVQMDPLGGVTVYASTQAMFRVRADVAAALGIPEQRVRVLPMMIGGGFGGKTSLFEPLVAACAQKTGRPVRFVMTRMEEQLAATPAPRARIHLKLGAKRDGTLTALQADVLHDSGAYPGTPLSSSCTAVGGCYRVPNLEIRGAEVRTHTVSVGSYRAPGVPQATFAIESQVDELARELGLDPIELRLRNLAEEGDPTPNGGKWARVALRECLERLAQHPTWQQRDSANGAAGGKVGYGLAVGFWQGGIDTAAASCEVEPDGTVQLTIGSVDVSGSSTSFAQIAAEVLGVPMDKVRLVAVDSSQAPYAGGSMGSKITRTVGVAVVKAAEEARRQILAIAADKLEASVDDLEIEDGTVRVRGVPDRSATVASLAKLTRGRTGYAPIFGSGGSAIKSVAPGSTAHLARVEVDEETGAVRVLDYVAVQDVGKAINPGEVEGQVRGGIAQGLGWALWERMAHDGDGQLLTASWLDYALPGSEGVPNVAIDLVEVPAKDGPFGAKGAGEPPIIPVSAAVANAIRGATGVRVTELPMSQERVAQALRQAGSGA